MPTHTTTDGDRVVIAKYLVEAHGKERQLETALQAQILIAQRPELEDALTDHLEVTRRQIDAIERRLSEIGQEESRLPGVAAAEAVAAMVGTVANKGLALAKGPIQVLRGTSLPDNELRNMRDCYWNEAEEIAHYHVIETVAGQLGDTETVALARKHRKEEEEMQQTLESLFPEVVRAVVEMEVPESARDIERKASNGRSASSSSSSTTRASTGSRSSAKSKPAASRAKSKARSTASKASSTASKASSTASKASSTASKTTSTASKSASGASKSTNGASKNGSDSTKSTATAGAGSGSGSN